MIFLLLFAVVSLSLVITAVIRYPLPASIFSRTILVLWLVGVTLLIVLMCRDLFASPETRGSHLHHTYHP